MNFKIFDINIERINYLEMRDFISLSISKKKKKLITYVTAASSNSGYANEKLKSVYSKYNLIHPDVVRVFLVSKFLYGTKGASEEITGSDFYPIMNLLIKKSKS